MSLDYKCVFDARNRWVAGLVAGFVAVLIVFTMYRHLRPNYPKSIVALSALMQLSPQEYLDAEQVKGRAGSPKFTTADWQSTKKLFGSDNKDQKVFALGVMGQMYQTTYRGEAARCAESSVTSSEPLVKAGSIATLARLHDPAWHDLALQNRDSPDDMVRHISQSLLERKDRFK